MERLNFFESILKILNTISSIPLFLEVLILTFILLIVMSFFYFRKSKEGKLTALIIYIVSLLLLPITFFSFFIETFDKIIENYIKILYFPSFYIYVLLLIYTNVVIFRLLIRNIKGNAVKWYNFLDMLFFCVLYFLFFMIIKIVTLNNINIFEISELYSNSTLMSCLQISSYLFWIRIGVILVNKIINKLSGFEKNKLAEVSYVVSSPKVAVEAVRVDGTKKYDKKDNNLLKKLLGDNFNIKKDEDLDNNDLPTKSKREAQKIENEYRDQYFSDDFFE